MKVKGEVVLLETPGRKDAWVKQKVETDYFLALKITAVDGQEVKTTKDFYEKLKSGFPEVYANNHKLNIEFQNITLPPGSEDMPHVSLGNFPDFRFDRDVSKGVDTDKVAKAENAAHKELEFEITNANFELAAATKEQAEKDYIENNITLSKENPRKTAVPTTVGFGRDAILTLKPDVDTQKRLSTISKEVFGNDFVLWNAEKKPLDYHISVGQTNEFIKTIKPLMQQAVLPANSQINDTSKVMTPTYY